MGMGCERIVLPSLMKVKMQVSVLVHLAAVLSPHLHDWNG